MKKDEKILDYVESLLKASGDLAISGDRRSNEYELLVFSISRKGGDEVYLSGSTFDTILREMESIGYDLSSLQTGYPNIQKIQFSRKRES